MLNVNIETIENNKYYSATDARGNTTMVFVWGGQMYLQTGKSPARCIEGVKRISKLAAELIEFVKHEEKKGQEEGSSKATNPRYIAFVEAHGTQPIYKFMVFIRKMKALYLGDSWKSIVDHDQFTLFIKNSAHKYEVEA